jgi:AcrR family transcriptional regulator
MKVNLEARALAAERKRARTRAALIEAAMKVIAERGPEAVSIADFVAAAGVSRGGFYNYFPTLPDLLAAVRDEVARRLDAEIEAALACIDDPAERLALILLRFIEMGVSDPVWGWVFLRLDSAPLPNPGTARERFRREYEAGLALGRFQEADHYAGYSLAAGAVRMAVRAMLSGAPTACGPETVRLVLMGLGLDAAEARRVCVTERAPAFPPRGTAGAQRPAP